MKAHCIYLLAGLLLATCQAAAQTQPLRVSPPAMPGLLTPSRPPISPDIADDAQCTWWENMHARLKARYARRRQYSKQQKQAWHTKMDDQIRLAQKLNRAITDSIQSVYKGLDSASTAGSAALSPVAVAAYHAELRKLDNAQARIAARIAAYQLREIYCRFQMHNADRLTFMPVTSRYEAPLFFNALEARPQAELLNQATTIINPKTGKLSLYNELFGDYVGWWRVAVGTTLVAGNQGEAATPELQKQETSLQRLVGGGGNILVSAALPIAYFHSPDNALAFKLSTTNNFATDLPQINSSSTSLAYHFNVGFDFTGYYRGSNNIITPFIYARLGRAWGNPLFYENLGRPDNTGITVGQLRFGIDVTDVLQVAGALTYGSAFIREQFPFAIALTLKNKLPTPTTPL